jgi:hypothetical protein
MKSTLYSTLLKTALLIVPLSLYLSCPTLAVGRDRSLLSPGLVRPGVLDYPAVPAHGYLTVHITAAEFNDGSAWYFPHSFYAIYTIDGKLFRNVTSQPSADDEIPDVVALPVGSYMVVGRSEKDVYIRLPVVIRAGQRTTLDLDLRERAR